MEGLTFPNDWQTTITEFLKSGATPSDRSEAHLLRRRAGRFVLIGDQLYKKAFSGPLLKCVGPEDVDYILQEVHQGSCGGHPGDRSLARKILLVSYFWPTLQEDAARAVATCLSCQSNGQAEVAIREILRVLRARLDHEGGSWVDVLPEVLWALRTTPKEGTEATPFHLVYGGEVIVPVEVGVESDRIRVYDENNAELRHLELDLVDEVRAKATVRLMAYQQRMKQNYNRRIMPRSFQEVKTEGFCEITVERRR
ncbi:uncharacterized protein LOC121990803 [Zingiber officinale]|uniref:uncharacterized protein LOC121990803 n=1 Tax=Zingiber officinale TaxID=94328 RepID=UPI001C4AC53C|nr:uncharacterized protein LOC121990803 [Zingiber officinale]